MNERTKECISHLGKLKHFTKKKALCGIEKGNTESFKSFLTYSCDFFLSQTMFSDFISNFLHNVTIETTCMVIPICMGKEARLLL